MCRFVEQIRVARHWLEMDGDQVRPMYEKFHKLQFDGIFACVQFILSISQLMESSSRKIKKKPNLSSRVISRKKSYHEQIYRENWSNFSTYQEKKIKSAVSPVLWSDETSK